MKIKKALVDSIKPYQNNPRHNAEAVEYVKRSIQQFGFRQPIVVDQEGVIVAGHTRWMAAKALGLETVPVHVADLTPEQARAYRIADNKTADRSAWDNDKLIAELAALSESIPDLRDLGFTQDELDSLSGKGYSQRELEDFEAAPIEGVYWILMRATESDCALALNALRKLKLKSAHIEFSGDKKNG